LLPGETARPLIPFAGDTSLTVARTVGNEAVTWREVGSDLFGIIRGLRDGIVSGAELIKAGGEAGAPVVGFSYSPLGQSISRCSISASRRHRSNARSGTST
jgi:hypothetical protein